MLKCIKQDSACVRVQRLPAKLTRALTTPDRSAIATPSASIYAPNLSPR